MTAPVDTAPANDGANPSASSSGRAALLVGAGIFLSRIAGLIREVVLNSFFGTTRVADAFRAALSIPGLLQNVLGEGVLSASFIPVYSELLERDRKEAGRVAGAVATLLGLLTSVIVLIGILLVEPIASVLLFNLSAETRDIAIDLMRIMWAGLGFVVMAAWCLGVLNAHRRFFLSYVSPVLWNAAQVGLALWAWLADWSSVDIARNAAWGVLVGGALQFLVQLPVVLRVAPSLRLGLGRSVPGVKTVLGRFGPALIGRGIVQLSAFLDLILATALVTGALAALFAAQVLYLLPIGIFAMSVAAADLPELAREQGNDPRLAARLRTGLERTTFFVLFSAVAFLAAGHVLVGALYERETFTSDDTILVWLVLAAYSIGLLPSAASRVYQTACYAAGDVKGPMRIALTRVLVAAAIGSVLMLQADRVVVDSGAFDRVGDLPAFGLLPDDVRARDDVTHLGAVGLALGSAAASWLEYGLLQRRVKTQLRRMRPLGHPARRLIPAAAVAGVIGGGLTWITATLPPILAAPFVLGISGFVYVVLAHYAGASSATRLLRTTRLIRRS
jgi:putative peptidoglycan lipid II flippase